MRPSASTRTKLALIGLILMWLASIEQQPGGLTAFASEMQSVEQGIGAATVQIDHSIERASGSQVVEFMDGVVCERDATTQKVIDSQCRALVDPDLGE